MCDDYMKTVDYVAPPWASLVQQAPKSRIRLGIFPTPVHRWELPGLPEGVEVFVKRDDLTGMQLSGNKVRKLEFLMAEAKAKGHDSVITIGGVQSNHCRATAVAARYVGLDSHLILRVDRGEADNDPGLSGNLLVDRLMGSEIHKVSLEEYVKYGSMELARRLKEQLVRERPGINPYIIPVGGSNGLGTWGYVNCVEEIVDQMPDVTDIVMVRLWTRCQMCLTSSYCEIVDQMPDVSDIVIL
eukprot:gene19296-25943_t